MKSVSTSKLKILLWFVYIFFILNLIFLIRWQVFEHDRFIALARERIVDNKVPSIRGDILARDGSSLAYSEPRFNIIVYKTELEFAEKYKKQTRDEFVSKVGKVLGIKEATLTQMLENDKDWVKITEKITNDKKDELLSLKRDNASDQELEGIRIEYTSERIYPEHELACHAIGFVGKNDIGDDLGRAGLEHYWEGLLKEQEGYNSSEVDSFGNLIALNNVSQIEAKRGATIYTTIDKNIQSIVQKNIQAAVKKYDAKSATAIVMNPKTGEILALANYPDFDPNDYEKVKDAQSFKNPAISDPAELGSVGKAFTMSAALNEGKIQPNTQVTAGHSGCVTIKENERDWKVCTYDKRPMGPMTATQALVNSDNLALYEIMKLVGPEKFNEYLKAFGIGRRTDIDISGESNGELKDVSEWTNVDSATYAYGHGYQMTEINETISCFQSSRSRWY
ncbi:MAG: Cell division protein FtsI, Peptidoglycan synthetase [candidate division WS6 bacterium GW2011_GWA2_37_6]|uniref:Cell division protein FtsI, Peptidoglycan synthetase n=1 Tax=candidate division WS6 bacterium GW2011_GWA2_37_6 TaxID=1619087 RepID=A0A0G0K1L5_9BACT|nr:MAG: Cell division protein FtsI, Peptidoglycan synthetase [candidate division WS6 bacterium GW2011_GWA2_37_6]